VGLLACLFLWLVQTVRATLSTSHYAWLHSAIQERSLDPITLWYSRQQSLPEVRSKVAKVLLVRDPLPDPWIYGYVVTNIKDGLLSSATVTLVNDNTCSTVYHPANTVAMIFQFDANSQHKNASDLLESRLSQDAALQRNADLLRRTRASTTHMNIWGRSFELVNEMTPDGTVVGVEGFTVLPSGRSVRLTILKVGQPPFTWGDANPALDAIAGFVDENNKSRRNG
jgi:hypothetical protein